MVALFAYVGLCGGLVGPWFAVLMLAVVPIVFALITWSRRAAKGVRKPGLAQFSLIGAGVVMLGLGSWMGLRLGQAAEQPPIAAIPAPVTPSPTPSTEPALTPSAVEVSVLSKELTLSRSPKGRWSRRTRRVSARDPEPRDGPAVVLRSPTSRRVPGQLRWEQVRRR